MTTRIAPLSPAATAPPPEPAPRPGFAFLTAVPIAVLGGLIGLGGAEFRLPVLAGPDPVLAELIGDDVGYPLGRRTPGDIARGLRVWLADPAAGVVRGARGRAHVETCRRFSDEAARTLALYARAGGGG